MKIIIIRNKNFIKDIIKEGCYELKHHGIIYWNGIPIKTKEEFKQILTQAFHSPLDVKKSKETNKLSIVITPFIRIKDLHTIINND